MKRMNFPHRRAARATRASERQAARQLRSPGEQFLVLQARGVNHITREVIRLTKQLALLS